MTRRKKLVCLALCLIAVLGTAGVQAEGATTNICPEVVINESKVHKETLSGKDIASTTYTSGRNDSDSTATKTVTPLNNGQRLRFQTENNKLAEFYFVPFTTSLTLPAYTTCTVEQTFGDAGLRQ